MSARAIVTGALHKPAEIRTSKNQNQFAVFTLRENINGATRWWQAIAFSESAIETLREMQVGEPIAVAGEITAEIYSPAGSEGRINWRCTVDAVLTARKAKPKPDQAANLQLEKPQATRNPQAARNAPADGKTYAERSWAAPTGSITITSGRRGLAQMDDDISFRCARDE
jgi:hypothetical protein